MRNQSKIIILIFIFLTCSPLWTQEYNPQILENILEEISIETGSSPELDDIENIIEKKIELKNASIADFLQIPGFTSSEAKLIIKISRMDTIINIDQIINILNLTYNQIMLLKLCTTLNTEDVIRKIIIRTRNNNRLHKVYGISKNKFKGTALDLYNRASIYYKDFSANLLIDKDLGELHLADFFSANFSGKIDNSKFILGDYYLELGMGSLFWKSFPMRKGAEVITPAIQEGVGIKPYRSSIDYNYFRGIAIEHKINFSDSSNLNFISWYSNRNISATIDSANNIASSIYKTGYYRTENEINKKNALNEQSYGLNFEYSNEFFKVGVISDYMLYDRNIESSSSSVFSGKEGLLFSAYSFYNIGSAEVGVELSRDNNNNFSLKASSEININDLDLAFAYRRFPKDFTSQFGYNFGEFSYVSNEQGFYTGLKYKGLRNILFSSYVDFYSSFGPTFFVDKPVNGIDLFFQTNWKISQVNSLIVRIRNENKTDAIKNQDQEKKILQKQVSRIRLEYKMKYSNIMFRLRTEMSYVNFRNWIKDELGFMSSIDLTWKTNEIFSLSTRAAIFSTPSYESAIWQFEMTVPGYMSTRALYGKGIRAYINCKFSPLKFLDIRLSYITMYKPDVNTMGSGYLEINDNIDNRAIVQLDFKL